MRVESTECWPIYERNGAKRDGKLIKLRLVFKTGTDLSFCLFRKCEYRVLTENIPESLPSADLYRSNRILTSPAKPVRAWLKYSPNWFVKTFSLSDASCGMLCPISWPILGAIHVCFYERKIARYHNHLILFMGQRLLDREFSQQSQIIDLHLLWKLASFVMNSLLSFPWP